jgi:energy-converting hydrogenase Eha subunit A
MATLTSANSLEQLELFSEADMESIEAESLEAGIESQLEETLESVSNESVAEDVEAYMEGDLERRTPSSYVIQQLVKVFTALIKNAVKKITSNPRTRAKLQAACRKSPDAVTQLLTPIITKTLPTYFKWMSAIFVPPIVARLFPAICKQAGLKPEEIPVVAEFWGALFSLATTVLPSVINFFGNRRRRR